MPRLGYGGLAGWLLVLSGRHYRGANKNPGKPLRKNSRLAGVQFVGGVVYWRLVLAAGLLGGSAVDSARLQLRTFYLMVVYGKLRFLSTHVNR